MESGLENIQREREYWFVIAVRVIINLIPIDARCDSTGNVDFVKRAVE